MKILMIHTQGGGVSYYRQTMPARALIDAGHEVTYLDGPFNFFLDIGSNYNGMPVMEWLEKHGPEHDLTHMGYSTQAEQITAINGTLRGWCKEVLKKDLPCVVDVDDDPHNVPTYNTAYLQYHKSTLEKKTMLMHLRTSDGVTVTKPQLQNVLKVDGKNFGILPNYTQPKDWQHHPHDPRRDEDKSIRIMFAGGMSHKGDLDHVQEEIEWVMEKYDGTNGKPLVRLFFLGCTPDWATKWLEDKRDPHTNRAFYIQPGAIQTYWKCIRWIKPDIFVAPIHPNIFNESKSCIKAYDAAMSGGAFLCSDWATYEEVPEDCAAKCSNNLQWRASLESLIEDKSIRDRLNKNILEWTLTNRNIDQHINKWVDYYTSVLDRGVITDVGDVIRPRIISEIA